MSRRIVVERHGGAITVDSRPGDTIVRVRLPCGACESEEGRRPDCSGAAPSFAEASTWQGGPPRALCLAQVTSELRDGSSSSPVCAAASASAMMRFSSSRFLRYCDTE